MEDWIKQLQSLRELRDAGILSEAELQAERDKIMRARNLRAASLDGPLEPNTLIGQYRVLSLIGEGGMGRVYKVEHKDAEFAAVEGARALKVMGAALMGEAELIRRFKQEALKGVKIRHPQMAQVFQFIEEDGVVGFLMELIEGDSLESRAPMSFSETLSALEPLAEMLDHLHSLGVVHRDVKPENVKLHPTRGPVLLDFGIAKDSEIDLTMTMRAMGTPLYMSPEQLNARQVTGATDQYALALMCYHLLSDRFPWPHDSSVPQIIAAKIANELDSRALEGVEEDIARVLARALSREPKDRYPTCAALCAALRALPPRGRSAPRRPEPAAPQRPEPASGGFFGEADPAGISAAFPHLEPSLGSLTLPPSAQTPSGPSFSSPHLPAARGADGPGGLSPREARADLVSGGLSAWEGAAEAFEEGEGASAHRRPSRVPRRAALALLLGGGAWWAYLAARGEGPRLPRAADREDLPRALGHLRARLARLMGLTPPEPPPAPPLPTPPSAGEARAQTHKGVTFTLTYCPPGDFEMGAPASERAQPWERPAHPMRVSRGLWVGQVPVTQAQYEAVMGLNPSRARGAELPVEQVSWLDAVRFCNALSALEGLEPAYTVISEGDAKVAPSVGLNLSAAGYRLPTEAEWERAARGGEAHRFAGGDELAEVALCGKRGAARALAPVAGRRPNAFGLYDMSGLVWEWCTDAWDQSAYKGREGHLSVDSTVYVERWERRVARGGSWLDDEAACAVWSRRAFDVGARSERLGFRVVRLALP